MKLLKRLRLINWHYFYNVKIDFDKINFLTGENAAGKSTLIDAMQVVLLGDTSGRIFNKAASEKAGRTLKGYLKAEVGDDGEGEYRYLRNGRFTSYIVLEFFDDVVMKEFCVGIVFDVYDDGTEQHKFFYLDDKMPVNDFCSLNTPLSQKELAEYFSQNYSASEYQFCDTNAQYQILLKDKFGGIKDKYFSLFKKAVSFTPITNIEQFITEYVCDVPSEINVESMRANIQQYKRLEIEATNMESKINRLEAIHKAYEDVKSRRSDLALSSYITKRVSYQVHLNNIMNLQRDIQANELRINEINDELKKIEEEIKEFTLQKESLIASKVQSSSYQMNKELTASRDKARDNVARIEANINSDYEKLSSYINAFKNHANRLQAGLDSIDGNFKNSLKNMFEELQKINSKVIEVCSSFSNKLSLKEGLNRDTLLEFRNTINEYKNYCSECYGYLKSHISSEINKLNIEKQSMQEGSTGGKSYDYQLVQVRNQLRHALEDKFSKKIEVYFFADLIDIKTPRWVNAIEGFINSQKINMFVEEEYYEAANKLLPPILKRLGYYRTGLVDSEKLKKANIIVDDYSLAEEIKSDHEGAKCYANFLLGRMIKCETFSEARACGRGLTPNCDGYRNYSSFVLPENSYRYHLIGRKISESNRNERLKDLEKSQESLQLLKEFVNALGLCAHEETMNNNETDTFALHFEDAELLPQYKKNLQRYEDELASSSGQEINIIDEKIRHIEQDLTSLNDDKQRLILQKGQLTESNNSIQNEKIPSQMEKANEILDTIKQEFDEDFINDIALPTYNEEIEHGKSLVDLRYEYDEMFTKGQYRLRNILSQFNELRKDYIVDYKLSYDITREDNDDFDKELYTLKEVKLPEYRKKIEDAYNKATKEFKDDFIFKLKTSIEMVRNQIDELNEALKGAHFGSDSYQFTVTPAPQYKEYYDMITDDLLLSYGEDESIYLEKYQDIMNNLFKLIGDVSSSKDKESSLSQNVDKFTDYRTYLLFDLMVSKDGGKPYSLARNIKKASGGETQTPFYISILASFTQLYRTKADGNMSNTIRLVIFDEAFSKMDRNRIIESIRILKEFKLQVILSAPPEKVADISRLVDKTLLVSRGKNRSFVDTFAASEEIINKEINNI